MTDGSSRLRPRYEVLPRQHSQDPDLDMLRRMGVQDAFEPATGRVFITVRFPNFKLIALAAVCRQRVGSSVLADVLARGDDPVVYAAALLADRSLDDFGSLEHQQFETYKHYLTVAHALLSMVPTGMNGDGLAGVLMDGLKGLTGEHIAIIWHVNDRLIAGDRTAVLGQMRDSLNASQRVYLYDSNIVYERRSQKNGNRLLPLMIGDHLSPAAVSHLSNSFYCAMPGEDQPKTYQVPSKVLSELLNSEATREQLPRISFYSRRPVFNKHLELCGPGYWAADGLLIHGQAITPVIWSPPTAERAIDRLPPGLKHLFKNFCFQTDADLVNALAALQTGVLVNHFSEDGKPLNIVTGNRRGLGKTLLAVACGLVLDGEQPRPLQHSEDEDEMSKRLGTRIKPGVPFSVLLFDNRKSTIDGSLLESLALAPHVSVRLLGHNEDIGRANDFLWWFTANHAQATADATDRATVIRMYCEDNPKDRFAKIGQTEEKLKTYIREHRQQILAELTGMVVRWCEAGQPLLAPRHRAQHWSAVFGGILQTVGLPEFLTNQEEATQEIDVELQGLPTLAEHVVGKGKQGFFSSEPVDESSFGKSPKEWVTVFREAAPDFSSKP